MVIGESERALSISRIARAADLPRHDVAALIRYFRIPVLRGPSMTVVMPEARGRLIEILECHPDVESGLDDRL